MRQKDRDKRELATQREWIEEHGSTIEGYRQRYANAGVNPDVIFAADMEYLKTLEERAGEPELALARELNVGDAIMIRGRKMRIVRRPHGVGEFDRAGKLLYDYVSLELEYVADRSSQIVKLKEGQS